MHRRVAGGVTVSLACLAVLVAGCSADEDAHASTTCSFDSAEWARLDPDDDAYGHRRMQMADVVIECGLLDGASRAEVAGQLGKGGDPEETRWEYLITPSVIDYWLLVVDFGPDGTVSSMSLGQS